MTADASQIDALDRKGDYGTIVRAFGSTAQLRGSDGLTRVTVAHAYAITGNFDTAWKLAAQRERIQRHSAPRSSVLYASPYQPGKRRSRRRRAAAPKRHQCRGELLTVA